MTSGAASEFANRLLPHQREFVDEVFAGSTKRVIRLRAPVGLGKSAALVGVASRLLENHSNARVLLLAASALKEQFAAVFAQSGVRTLLLDRYVFREMVDASVSDDIWPPGVVVIAAIDFAKYPDVLDKLARHWDLLIIDEWHQAGRSRMHALSTLNKHADRVVLVSGTPEPGVISNIIDSNDVTEIEWQIDQIVGADGRRLVAIPPLVPHEVVYKLTQEEHDLHKAIKELVDATNTSAHDLRRTMLIAGMSSSPASLESVLRRLLDRTTLARNEEDVVLEDTDGPEGGDSIELPRYPESREGVVGAIGTALKGVEELAGDSKLTSFLKLVTSCPSSARIVVLTEFRPTLFYLAAELEVHGIAAALLHGGMGFDDRLRNLERFRESGGILIGTLQVMQTGVDLRDATDLVLYDAPRSKGLNEQVMGRFQRVGRTLPLNVYSFEVEGSNAF